MRLISLTANKPSFRPVKFNPSGLSLIVGKPKVPANNKDAGKTFNGVGKSLLIALINFCLGSDKNENFENTIPGWEFSLTFEIEKERHIVIRNTTEQGKPRLDGKEISINALRSFFEENAFSIPESVKGVSFRSLITRFIRPQKESYMSFDVIIQEETPYYRLLNMAFLLGFNMEFVQKKHNLKTKKEQIVKFRDNLTKDEIFQRFFTSDKNADIELKDLDEKITALDSHLKEFKVADDYHAIEEDANLSKRKLQEVRNYSVMLENAINNIGVSLSATPETDNEKLLGLLKEVDSIMPAAVKKRIDDVLQFHSKLIVNRVKRLSEDRKKLEIELIEQKRLLGALSRDLDMKLQFLNTHGALDEFVSLTNHKGEFASKAQKIRDYKELLKKYADQLRDISINLINETKLTNEYLSKNGEHFAMLLDKFRGFSKRFYPDRPGGLTVENNEGDNQVRFNINTHIQDDASDGINEVKIFCFDMTLLVSHFNHYLKFVLHDSRLFSDIDPRQRANLFKIAQETTSADGLQYIATLNEDLILAMKDQFTEQEFENIILKNTVLELTDDNESGKLLGVQVDMQY